jgi:CspA family cold shock protein
MYGTVKFFNSDRGYGFIRSREAGELFFHVSRFDGDEDTIERDLPVEFDLGEGEKGVMAVNIRPANGGNDDD